MVSTEFAVLVLPGLLDPPSGAQTALQVETPLDALSALFCRATRHDMTGHSFEAVLGKVFDCTDPVRGDVPVAALEWPLYFQVESSQTRRHALPTNGCLRADPVHLQVDRDQARLIEGEALDLSDGEAAELVDALNAHFAEDAMQFHRAGAKQWFLTAGRALDVNMSPPGYAAGRNVHHFFPSGDSGGYWKALLTEVQMLLHTHPVNQHRQAHGQREVNSVWLWGGGVLPGINSDKGNDISTHSVYTDEALPKAMAERRQQPVRPLPTNNLSVDQPFTLVDATLLSLSTYSRTTEWVHALAGMEARYFVPLVNALKRSHIPGVSVYPCNGQRIDISRVEMKKFWRKRTPLQDYFSPQEKVLGEETP